MLRRNSVLETLEYVKVLQEGTGEDQKLAKKEKEVLRFPMSEDEFDEDKYEKPIIKSYTVTKQVVTYIGLTIGFALLLLFGLSHFKPSSSPTSAHLLSFSSPLYHEEHRPRIHFSNPQAWMNDPNGLVFHDGIFHLFYQHNPHANVWGPMHWGHAKSTDLIHWTNEGIKLYPDKHGTIFSGCVIVDERNLTGYQKNPRVKTLVAYYTQHLETTSGDYIERQSLAYSLDNGNTWQIHKHNPIVEEPAYTDFRDPKVLAYKDHYIMALSAADCIVFYKSYDLKRWKKLSEFGKDDGSHGGVWECPDLFPLKIGEEWVWVLLVSINPGGPNKGSVTQYFIGDFDGTHFKNLNSPETTLWLDYGPDSYAGITWYGTPQGKRFFIGWMNNWNYGNSVPTAGWRGQMTIPRELHLKEVSNKTFIASRPVSMIDNLRSSRVRSILDDGYQLKVDDKIVLVTNRQNDYNSFDISLDFDVSQLSNTSTIELCFQNDISEKLCVRYHHGRNSFIVDRSLSGKVQFHDEFSKTSRAPRMLRNQEDLQLRLLVDISSIELFADDGLTVMTSLFFPHKELDTVYLQVTDTNLPSFQEDFYLTVKSAQVYTLKSIWP